MNNPFSDGSSKRVSSTATLSLFESFAFLRIFSIRLKVMERGSKSGSFLKESMALTLKTTSGILSKDAQSAELTASFEKPLSVRILTILF